MSKNTSLEFTKNKYWVDSGFDFERRYIDIPCEIDDSFIADAVRAIKLMDDLSSQPIDVFINSFGGEVYSGLALYDAIRDSKSLVRTHCRGKVMSMGFVIFLAGDERYATENATFMAHSVSTVMIGKTRDLEVEVDEVKRLNDVLTRIVADRTKPNIKWWRDKLKHEDFYFNLNKAKQLKVVTHG